MVNGVEIPGVSVGFKSGSENWSDYLLDDGSVIKLKPVVMEIVRLDGRFEPDGTPAYAVKAQNVVATSAPDNLRKRPGV